jgi:hypothetical protein
VYGNLQVAKMRNDFNLGNNFEYGFDRSSVVKSKEVAEMQKKLNEQAKT